MKNLNSIDSRWVVETTVKIWEISGGEEIFWVWLKWLTEIFRYFTRWILITSQPEFYLCCYTDSPWEFPPPGTSSFNTHSRITCQSSPEISKTLGFGHLSAIIVSGPRSLLSEFEIHSVQRCVPVDY